MNLFRLKDGNSTNHKFNEHALLRVVSVHSWRLDSTRDQTKNTTTSHFRNSANRLPLRRGLLLIPVMLVWFGRPEHANATDLADTLQHNSSMNTSLWSQFNAQNNYRNRLAAAEGLPPDWESRLSNREPLYQPQPARSQFRITATDFKPTTARIVPVEWLRRTSGLTPEQRQLVVMQNNLFLNDFERSRRKNNVAASCAYLVSVCLYVVNGGGFWDPNTEAVLTRAFNDNLANSLQF